MAHREAGAILFIPAPAWTTLIGLVILRFRRILCEGIKHLVADKKLVSRKIRRTRRLCLKNNSIYILRCRWNPQTLSLATHDGWRSVNATPRMAAPRLEVKIINGFNRLNGNFRLRDFMVRCTRDLVPWLVLLGRKQTSLLYSKDNESPKFLILPCLSVLVLII